MSADQTHNKVSVTVAARRGLKPFRDSRASLVLGGDHPLSRAATVVHALVRQVTATSGVVALGVLAVAAHRTCGIRLLCAALIVELTLVGILALAQQVQRERVLRLIASGHAQLPVEEVACQARRLATPRHHAQLARRLERGLEEAICWHQLAVASRPPPGIRLLCAFAPEVHAIVDQLRSGKAALPGVALLELFLIGGYGSSLYAGDRDALREQLWRIRSLLSHPASAEADDVAGLGVPGRSSARAAIGGPRQDTARRHARI
jgi:hypothetical protein